MDLRLLRWTLAGMLAMACLPAAAQSRPATVCEVPPSDKHPLLGRQERIAQFEGLGEQCLKALALDCNDLASRQLVDTESAFTCSIGYEALLRTGFRGDFNAMLAWWRRQRETSAVN